VLHAAIRRIEIAKLESIEQQTPQTPQPCCQRYSGRTIPTTVFCEDNWFYLDRAVLRHIAIRRIEDRLREGARGYDARLLTIPTRPLPLLASGPTHADRILACGALGTLLGVLPFPWRVIHSDLSIAIRS
jgi:hypothetical protein